MANINCNAKIALLAMTTSLMFGCTEEDALERSDLPAALVVEQPETPDTPDVDEPGESPIVELAANGTFEDANIEGWSTNDGESIVVSTDEDANSGTYSGKITGRTASWNGAQYNMNGVLAQNKTYDVSIWVKLINSASSTVKLSARVSLVTGDEYIAIAEETATSDGWLKLSGLFSNNFAGSQSAVSFYVEGPDAGVEYYIDDLSVMLNAASETQEYSPVTVTNLHTLAEFPIGVAVPAGNAGNSLLNSPDRQNIVTTHFNQLSAENIMKMDALHPSETTFNFIHADALVNYANNNDLTMHGHVLVWHSQTADWMENYSGDTAAWVMMMENHVTQIATHFAGKLASWDVVNEAFNEDGSYRSNDSIWYTNIGESFIEKAFVAAKAADSEAELYYNDFNISWNEPKLDAIITMAKDFQARDIPIDGIGFQMHISSTGPDKAQLAKQMQKVVDLGLKVKITELDIRMNMANGSTELNPGIAEIQKKRFFDVISTYLDTVPSEQRGGISVWGLIDSDSWIIDLYGNPDWPLMFNDDYTAKPALQGFADALLAETTEPTPEPAPTNNEILTNPDFETGTDSWFGHGDTLVTLETTEARSGSNSAKATGRTDTWNGIAHGLDGALTAGATYHVSAWVKLANAASDTASLTVKLTDDEGDHYVPVNSVTATDGEWMLISGTYTHTVVGSEVSAYVYVEGPAAGVDYYIDDVSVTLDEGEVDETPTEETPAEILANPDFEAGTDNWFGHGDTLVTLETTEARTGSNSGKATGRTDTWNGIAHGLDGALTAGETYHVSAWVKLANAASDNIGLTVKLTDDEGDHYVGVNSVTATDGEWMQLSGTYTHTVVGTEVTTYVYIEGAAVGVEYYIDDISVTLAE